MTDLTQWKPCPLPQRVPLEGAWCRLEPLEAARHGDQLFEASMAPGADARFRYLFESPCDRVEFDRWLARAVAADDPLAFAVIDRASGRCEGRQTLMRITPDHGVIEIGSILWGPAISRSRVATEALYLFARYAFETLGYRRFEWKCNSLNAPSIRAAGRFGFRYEGQFRQHMVTKGANRDTHWFSMIDTEWPALRAAFDRWLAPENFDAQGRQRATLESFRP
ncbi:MAG: GNAT family N-acetyltransferase [Burkholderiaceae bacterium]|nr:GNAT family N-acetyltransferase [Burkholderiaceae bacterium]